MASIRVVDDGSTPRSWGKASRPRSSRANTMCIDTADDLARYWNKLPPWKDGPSSAKQSRKENKDVRLILDAFVHKPAKTK
jgi:hypothetical protein